MNFKNKLLKSNNYFPIAIIGSLVLHILIGITLNFQHTKPDESYGNIAVELVLSNPEKSSVSHIPDKKAFHQTSPIPQQEINKKTEKKEYGEISNSEKISRPPVSESKKDTLPILEETEFEKIAKEKSIRSEIEKDERSEINEAENPQKEKRDSEIPINHNSKTENLISNPESSNQDNVNSNNSDIIDKSPNSPESTTTVFEELSGYKGKRSLPAPSYPESARRFGYEGTVLVEIGINSDGSIKFVNIINSNAHSTLENICLQTIKRKWRFVAPGREITTCKEFSFVLD